MMEQTGVDDWAASNVWLDLPDDGSQAVVVFCADPIMFATQSQFGMRERAVFPVLTDKGLRAFGASKRTTRYIRSKWREVKGQAVRLQRIGAAGSTFTTYKLYRQEGQDDLVAAAAAVKAEDVEALLAGARTGGMMETGDGIPI